MSRPAILLTVAVAVACTRPDPPRPDPTAASTPVASIAKTPSASAAASTTNAVTEGPTIYPLATELTDQNGVKVALDLFRGHPVIIGMFYATCKASCPVLVSDIKAIEAALTADERADLRVLLVSFDPTRDTPAVLDAMSQRLGVDRDRWRLATSTEGGVRELAAALGVQYRTLQNGEYSHSAIVTLLDREGAPLARIDGMQMPADALLAKLRALPRRAE